MDIREFHKYSRLARRGFVDPLVCPSCEHEYVFRLGEHDEPVLQCTWCNTLVYPGLRLYNKVRAVVKEFYE